MSVQDREHLAAIHLRHALPAAVEYDLEERGLITTSDAPYAELTDKGRAILDTPTRSIRVRRENGSRVTVEVADVQHYEVTVEGGEGADYYQRYVLVRAAAAPAAKRAVVVADGERAITARKVDLPTVAVLTLNGMEVA